MLKIYTVSPPVLTKMSINWSIQVAKASLAYFPTWGRCFERLVAKCRLIETEMTLNSAVMEYVQDDVKIQWTTEKPPPVLDWRPNSVLMLLMRLQGYWLYHVTQTDSDLRFCVQLQVGHEAFRPNATVRDMNRPCYGDRIITEDNFLSFALIMRMRQGCNFVLLSHSRYNEINMTAMSLAYFEKYFWS